MNDAIRNLLRQLPSMDELLALPWVSEMEERLGRDAVKGTFSEVVGEWRQAFREGTREALDRESLTEEARARLETRSRRSLRRVLNGTGVVVHTNLGRSLLPPQAVEAEAQQPAPPAPRWRKGRKAGAPPRLRLHPRR